MNTKRVIFLACCALIGAIAFGTLNIHMTHAFGTRIATNTAYYENNEKRSVDASDKTIIILISGSTNTCPTTMNVRPSGTTTYQACHSTHNGTLPPVLTHTFFGDVQAAQPLSALPRNDRCIKSTSFGTTTHIKSQGQESPDISCSIDPFGMKLNTDVQAIQSALHYRAPRHPISPMSSI